MLTEISTHFVNLSNIRYTQLLYRFKFS